MKIGKLNKRIELWNKERVPDDMGGYSTESVKKATVWAEFLRPRFAQKIVQGDGSNVEITQGIRIRPVTIAKGWLVKYKNIVYEVLHVDESIKGEIILTTIEVKANVKANIR